MDIRVIHQHLNHGGDKQHVCHAVGGNGLQHTNWVKTREHDVAAACGKQAIHEGTIGQMEHGGGMQANAAASHCAFGHAQNRVGVEVAMTEHHALGRACGAAGIEHPSQIIAAAHGIFDRRSFGNQRFI